MAEANIAVAEEGGVPRPLCSRCAWVMTPSIYRCGNGHNYCEDCHFENRLCLLCPQNGATNHEPPIVFYSCRWNAQCQALPYDKIRAHEYTCDFRKYQCPICKISIFLQEMKPHFTAQHSFMEIFLSNVHLGKRTSNPIWFLVVFREIFLCEVTIKPSGMAWSVRLLSGRYSRARNFKVYLSLSSRVFTIPISDRVPCFVLNLPNTELPPDNNFMYWLTVLPSEN